MKEDHLVKEILSAVPDALASPFTKWHEDNLRAQLTSERMLYEHQERQRAMRYQHKEHMELARLQRERLETLRVAMENGYIHPVIGKRFNVSSFLMGSKPCRLPAPRGWFLVP